jgi:hypothetical protein
MGWGMVFNGWNPRSAIGDLGNGFKCLGNPQVSDWFGSAQVK